jgi:hypothetical protein
MKLKSKTTIELKYLIDCYAVNRYKIVSTIKKISIQKKVMSKNIALDKNNSPS